MRNLKTVRLAFVANTAFSLYQFRRHILQHYLEMGYEVYCVAPTDDYAQDLLTLGVTFIDCPLDRHGSSIFKDLSYAKRLRQIYLEYKFDHIFHYTIKPNIYGSIIAQQLGIKSWAFVTGLGYTYMKKNVTSSIARKLYHYALPKADKVIFLNTEDRNVFTKSKTLNKMKTIIMPGEGINVEHFVLDGIAKEDKVNFVFIGRLIQDKGFGELIEACKKLNQQQLNFSIQVVGDIDEHYINSLDKEDIEKIKQEIHNIQFHGYLKDILPILKKCHYLVLPSYREGMSTVVMESMACRRPAIGTNVPGIRDIIEHNSNGFLCQSESTDDLVKVMKQAILLPSTQYQTMAHKARQRIMDQFSSEAILSLYSKHFNVDIN